MILWSRLKTYLRIKPVGAAWCAACDASDIALTSRWNWHSPFVQNGADYSLLGLRLQPLVEIILRHDVQISLHVVMAKTAKLGTDDFVLADLGRGEVKGEIESGHEILLDAQLANVEGMTHVLGVHHEVDFLVDRNDHFAGRDVIASGNIVLRIQAKEIRIAFIDLFRVDAAELAIGPG